MRQIRLRRLGRLVQANSGRVLVALTLALLALCVAIKSVKFDAELANWIQRTTRIETELDAVDAAVGDGSGTNSLLLLQTPRQQHADDVLTVDALMVHLEAMAIATRTTVDLYEVSWSLRDICFAPTLPNFEGLHVTLMLDNLMPCAIKTPLDCFWEGSKLLGPEQPVSFGSRGPKFNWTNLNPLPMVEALQRDLPHASFSYPTLIDWMRRLGITTGYQMKPCLDPHDPSCPLSAPNKISKATPNVAKTLTGGCRGIAANLMHWQEEELIGGVTRNRSGHLTRASALQSSIQLMGEVDMYDYWRKTSKVQDIHNWSAEKAKKVLETWQLRYKEGLAEFSNRSLPSSKYKVFAMTTDSMLEPIDMKSLLDLRNVQICFTFMTLILCFAYPNFSNNGENPDFQITTNQLSTTLLALSTSLIVGLTFVASLGVSSFMNLPINIATAHILPPLALYYGFRQSITIGSIYAQKSKYTELDDLTTDCLEESLPIIAIESLACILSLLVASLMPVQATQVFAFQAITFTLMSTLTAFILIPAMHTKFILHYAQRSLTPDLPPCYSATPEKSSRPRSRSESPGKFSLFGKNNNSCKLECQVPDIHDQIMSRIEDDLKNIKADPPIRPTTNVNFSAKLDINGRQTSFRVSAMQANSNIRANMDGMPQERNNQRDLNHSLQCVPLKNLNQEPDDLTDKSSISESECPPDTIQDDKDDQNDHTIACDMLAYHLTSNKLAQIVILLAKLCMLAAIVTYIPNVKYGLQLRDIVIRGTSEYESFLIQEKNFPIYNIFAVTKGNFDYPSNQKLLYEYHKRIENVDGVIKEEDNGGSRFWLSHFRDWLVELQLKFDIDKNKSAISTEGWSTDASDAAKLAYKLLAQTGRVDNPIDKSQVDKIRLVDSQGIINPKAFYYYLTAWVVNDAFTYSISGANFRPEPKIWNDNPDDLRVERARPLTYSQIPLLVKLPSTHDNLKTILEIRTISQAFEKIGLPNFPTGIPFIFWDQFINLDYSYYAATVVSSALIFVSTAWVLSNLSIAAITVLPIFITLIELYGVMGLLSISFNNILAVLLICISGISITQTVYSATGFELIEGDASSRMFEAFKLRLRMISTNALLLLASVIVFYNSKLDFLIKYSTVLVCLAIISTINSIFVAPVLLSVFGSDYETDEIDCESPRGKRVASPKRANNKRFKTRNYPRVKSEISLSTISEEPQSETTVHDFKLDFSLQIK